MKRCSFCEWIPILPWPVWPLAWQYVLGQNTVVGSMTILLLAVRGNNARRSMSGPRFLYNSTAPRLGVELPRHNQPENNLVLWKHVCVPHLAALMDSSALRVWSDRLLYLYQ